MRIVILVLVTSLAFAQQAKSNPEMSKQQSTTSAPEPRGNPEDVKSMDAIVAALYNVISGPPGERDWQRFHALFTPDAVLATVSKREGKIRREIMTPDDYVRMAGPYFAKNGFFEREASRSTQTFGNIAHLFSTYESRHTREAEPFARGINSIQLLNDGQRWWVLSILWDEEGPDNPIPPEYQPKH
jgi:hypothetical protein